MDTVRCERALDVTVASDAPGLVTAIPGHACGADIGGEFRQDLGCTTRKEAQVSTEGTIQQSQALVQPPAARGAHAPVTGIFIVKYVDRQDRPPGFGRGVERRIVGDSEILAEPDDEGLRSAHDGACRIVPDGRPV